MRQLLWKPSDAYIQNTRIYDFLCHVNKKYALSLNNYPSLHNWSVEHIPEFWDTLWQYLDIIVSQPYSTPVKNWDKMPGAVWFPDAKLNYAENILRYSRNEGPALIFHGEKEIRLEISHQELYDGVVRLATSFRADGIKPGDTIAAYMPNLPETVIGMLAAAAVGAIWCSCATDVGQAAAIDRLGQVKPRLLLTTDGYYYKGKSYDVLENAEKIAASIDSIEKVIITHYAGSISKAGRVKDYVLWKDYLVSKAPPDFVFEQLPSEHPLVVMFSSGTTGKPKCIVQSAGGLLINQLKELILHSDLKTTDRMLYITTCSWMMWNWQLAAIGTGCTVVLYDGNPSWPETSSIWQVLEEEKITIFGLSASYIHALMAEGFSPQYTAELSTLREIIQTGSVLSDAGFEFIYQQIKQDLFFNSIAGGTDINGCFCIASPIGPVYSAELQGPGLGMKVNCYDENARPLRDKQGELVCEAPCPSMPISFWNDPTGNRYFETYFKVYPNIWHHGDYIVIHSDTGGVTYYGRSDAVLKPSGVRIGTAEIYNQIQKIGYIEDSLAIGQEYQNNQRIVLFVKMKEGYDLTKDVEKSIRQVLRENASPRHVPEVILAVPDIPRTMNGKKVENVITNIINGRTVNNRDALSNPEILDYFESILPQLQ